MRSSDGASGETGIQDHPRRGSPRAWRGAPGTGPGPSGRAGPAWGALPARPRRWATNAAYGALAVLLAPYALARVLSDHKTRSRWRAYARDLLERFGRRTPRPGPGPCVWVHGVSVGEVKAAARLVDRLEAEVPGLDVVVTATTDTGRRVARERYRGRRVDFYPPDLSWIVAQALDAMAPDLVVLVESDLWPNFLACAQERGIPVVLVNGRLSEVSARRFRQAGPLGRSLLDALTQVCVQLDVHAERFRSLGVDPARVHVTGNMKLDNIPVRAEDARVAPFRRMLRVEDGRALIVAGSTHPGEERALARIRRRLAQAGLPCRLVVAPRHPARAEAVEGQIRREGLRTVRRSALAGGGPADPEAVVILDTVGELEAVYALAFAVFVGGTLVPHGGQNVMEPASLARPVVVGPHLHNFRGEVALLRQVDGIAVVPDEAGAQRVLEGWLRRPEEAAALGRRAQAAILEGKGATARTLAILRPLLGPLRARAGQAGREALGEEAGSGRGGRGGRGGGAGEGAGPISARPRPSRRA